MGTQTPSRSATYAEQIYVKLLAHCIMLRRLSPDPARKAKNEFWDVPSVSAIARCAIEAHDAFMYIAGPAVPSGETDLRILLWEAHDKTRRLAMLNAIGSSNPQKDQIQAEAKRLLAEIQSHALFSNLRLEIQKKVLKGDPPAFHLSQRELCQECKVDHDFYVAVTMQLSQYVHTFPFSVHQFFNFSAGSLESLRLMALPLQFAVCQ